MSGPSVLRSNNLQATGEKSGTRLGPLTPTNYGNREEALQTYIDYQNNGRMEPCPACGAEWIRRTVGFEMAHGLDCGYLRWIDAEDGGTESIEDAEERFAAAGNPLPLLAALMERAIGS